MGWWFGRKSAPADARPFVPAWLTNESAEEGFARSYSEQFAEVYQRNPVGQRSVRLVSGMLGALMVYAAKGDAHAAELVGADGLLESITANLLLHGNSAALQGLDVLVAPAVEGLPQAAPPASPVIGLCYIVGPGSTGVWAGRTNCVAAFTSGGWRYVSPVDGLRVYVRSTGTWATFRDGGWDSDSPAIASPSGGTTVDTQAREAVDQILGALRQHGLITV